MGLLNLLIFMADYLQMEFYFSDANLHKDRFMKQQLQQTSDGCEIFLHYSKFTLNTGTYN